ncbi:hypothetical protein [Streptodolium elevatio]
MLRHLRYYFDEEDTWFFYEVDSEGWTTRQVELEGPNRRAIAAASLAEFEHIRDTRGWDAAGVYTAKYGCTAEGQAGKEEDWSADDRPEYISAEEFEAHWRSARLAIETRRSALD